MFFIIHLANLRSVKIVQKSVKGQGIFRLLMSGNLVKCSVTPRHFTSNILLPSLLFLKWPLLLYHSLNLLNLVAFVLFVFLLSVFSWCSHNKSSVDSAASSEQLSCIRHSDVNNAGCYHQLNTCIISSCRQSGSNTSRSSFNGL